MSKIQKLHLPDETDKCAFFQKVFKEHQIALVDSSSVCEVKYNGYCWLRRFVRKQFSTMECCCYQYKNFAIIWQGRSAIPLFIMECELPFEIFSLGEYDFMVHKGLNEDHFCFERYTWRPEEQCYLMEEFDADTIPEDVDRIVKNKTAPKEPTWSRLYPHDDIETKSLDNTIFYDFIVKYAEK